MIKYKAGGYALQIEQVEVSSETEHFVTIQRDERLVLSKPRREAKRSTYDNYFDTWDDAFKFLADQADVRVEAASRILTSEQAKLRRVLELKPPTTEVSGQGKEG